MNWTVRIVGWLMVAFTIWLIAVILLDPGPGPCLSLGGC